MTTTYFSVDEIARKYDVKKRVLIQLIKAGVIETHKTPSGELLVAADRNDQKPETKEEIIAKEYGHLVDEPISIPNAADKYNIPQTTIRDWHKNEYLTVLRSGYAMEVNEADIAYCADIYHKRKTSGLGFRGVPLLDKNGLEYELKHEDLAKYRQRKRRKN